MNRWRTVGKSAGQRRPRVLWISTSLSTRGGISTFVRDMQETKMWRDWNVQHIATHRDGSIAARICLYLTGFARVIRELVRERPDISHIHTASFGSFFRKSLLTWVFVFCRVRVVLHVHGARFDEFFRAAPPPVRFLIRVTLERANAVVALGNAWARQLERIAPRANVVVVPNAIRPGTPVQQAICGPVHVVFLGEIGERKGAFRLLEAWALAVGPDRATAHLTLAGNGQVERARELVHQFGIAVSVDVHGWLSPVEVAEVLDSAHVLILPSLSEGQPMAVLEAMSRGLCVVASNVGGIPEMLTDSAGLIVDPARVDEIAGALSRVIADPDMRNNMGSKALQRVQTEFNIDVTSHRIDQLYRELVSQFR